MIIMITMIIFKRRNINFSFLVSQIFLVHLISAIVAGEIILGLISMALLCRRPLSGILILVYSRYSPDMLITLTVTITVIIVIYFHLLNN